MLTPEDIMKEAPVLAGHPKLAQKVLDWTMLEDVNGVHRRWAYDTGVPFASHLVKDEFKWTLRVDNEEILDRFPDGPFITVSNHPYGGIDGIILIDLVGRHRPDYKVMVNMFLYHITAMRSTFIPVDPIKTEDPAKRAVTMQGIRDAMRHVRDGHPLGFFPAGAVSKLNKDLHVIDREWQPTIIRLISQMKVPVIPIYFHGHNSLFFNILGVIDWRLRTLRLPYEVFNKKGKEIHISVGEPIMPDEQAACADQDALGKLLRERTYDLEKLK